MKLNKYQKITLVLAAILIGVFLLIEVDDYGFRHPNWILLNLLSIIAIIFILAEDVYFFLKKISGHVYFFSRKLILNKRKKSKISNKIQKVSVIRKFTYFFLSIVLSIMATTTYYVSFDREPQNTILIPFILAYIQFIVIINGNSSRVRPFIGLILISLVVPLVNDISFVSIRYLAITIFSGNIHVASSLVGLGALLSGLLSFVAGRKVHILLKRED